MPNAKTFPLPRAEEKADDVQAMFNRIAPRYDLVNGVMTGGRDRAWRRMTVRSLHLPAGSHVVDLACGTGALCRELERAGYQVTGVDYAEGMLDVASQRTRAPLIQADILDLPFGDATVDGITCGYALRNVTSIDRCFSEMARVLRTGGRCALLEVAEPDHPLIRRAHHVYFTRVIPFVGRLLSERHAYSYLPASVVYLPSPDELFAKLRAAGFVDIKRRSLGLGAVQLIVGTKA